MIGNYLSRFLIIFRIFLKVIRSLSHKQKNNITKEVIDISWYRDDDGVIITDKEFGSDCAECSMFCPILFPEEYYCPACAINRGFGGSMHIVRFGLKHKHICINCKNDYYEEDYEDFCEKDNNGIWILKSKK